MLIKEQESALKKAPKRFSYTVTASVELNKTLQTIQIQNISKTGIQFFSKVEIPNNLQIRLMWQDPQIGAMESQLLVVRTIEQQEESTFPYCYGSKFINLKEEVRKNVNRVVEITQETELKNLKKKMENVSFQTVNDVIVHGRMFVRDTLKGKKPSHTAEQFVSELKGYEKESFDKNDDEIAQWIQKLVTQSFHSRILSVMLTRPIKISDMQKLIMDKLQSMDCLAKECQKFITAKKSGNASIPTELKESLNRLIYARIELLEIFNKRTASPPGTRPL